MTEKTDTERRYWLERQDRFTLYGGQNVHPRFMLEIDGESYVGSNLSQAIELAMDQEASNAQQA